MTVPWRFLVVWLLALCLPLQAVAAAAMLHCHAAAPRETPFAAPAHADCDGTAHADAAPTIDGSSGADTAADLVGPSGTHACSACAACATQSALSHAVAWPSFGTASPAPDAAPQALRAAFIAEAPERPPRSLAA